MLCNDFTQFLELEPDGPLPASVATHLETCASCRLLWSDVNAIYAAGQQWGAEEPAPPARVWFAIRTHLESEGLIREPQQPAYWSDSFVHWFDWMTQRPALASVSLTVFFVAASLLHVQTYAPLNFVHSDVLPAASIRAGLGDDLHRTLDGDMQLVMAALPNRNSALAASLQQNLRIVDNQIVDCEKSVREQPDNAMAREYLYGAYQQKAVLLSAAMDRSNLEGR